MSISEKIKSQQLQAASAVLRFRKTIHKFRLRIAKLSFIAAAQIKNARLRHSLIDKLNFTIAMLSAFLFVSCPQTEKIDESTAEVALHSKCLDKAEAFSGTENAPLSVSIKGETATIILENKESGEFSLLLYCGDYLYETLNFAYSNGRIEQSGNFSPSSSSENNGESSSSNNQSNSSSIMQISKFELTYSDAGLAPPPPLTDNSPIENVSFYDAILICNKISKNAELDTLYKYGKPIFINDSLVYLPDLQVLEGKEGYRLPTKDEWIFANENGAIEKANPKLAEWLYSPAVSEYSLFELAPDFMRSVGLYRSRNDYPVAFGMRLVRAY